MPQEFKEGATHGCMVITKVPTEVRSLFAAACKRRGKSNRIVLIDLMKYFIKNDRKYGIVKNPRRRNKLPQRVLNKRFAAAGD